MQVLIRAVMAEDVENVERARGLRGFAGLGFRVWGFGFGVLQPTKTRENAVAAATRPEGMVCTLRNVRGKGVRQVQLSQ